MRLPLSVCGLILLSRRISAASRRPPCARRCRALLAPSAARASYAVGKRGGGETSAVARSLKKAAEGGLTGSIAGIIQVLVFMWLRTVMNYQYRHGGSTLDVLRKLWAEGKVKRLYRGLPYALVQGPLSRFGSAAANALVLALRDSGSMGLDRYPVFVVTALGSLLTALYRAALMPIDTLKTVSQVEGRRGLESLVAVAASGRPGVLYSGASAMAFATAIGHYPWFLTFNLLDALLSKPTKRSLKAARSALLGFVSSLASDLVANPIRVIKTTKQASAADTSLSYLAIVADILHNHGLSAFFLRGLSTRLLANGLQSMIFTVVWRSLLGE